MFEDNDMSFDFGAKDDDVAPPYKVEEEEVAPQPSKAALAA